MAKIDEWTSKEGLIKIGGWAKDGLTDEQISLNMGIARSTLSGWKKKYNVIAEALKVNKEIADRQVENALFKNATGTEYYEEVVTQKKVVTYKDGKRLKETVEPIVVKVQKFKPAETTAQHIWLRNRKVEWQEGMQS